MKLEIPRCPKCNNLAHSILESVLVESYVRHAGNGAFEWEYDRESSVAWDSMEPVEKEGKLVAYCSNNHEWETPDLDDVQPSVE